MTWRADASRHVSFWSTATQPALRLFHLPHLPPVHHSLLPSGYPHHAREQPHSSQQHVHQDDYYRHNIFDTSSVSSSTNSQPPVPSSSNSNNSTSSGTTGSIGPARTSRTRRNGSISGTSPPPTYLLTHGHQQRHSHHGRTPSLSHSLSHSGALNGGLNSMGSMAGFAWA